MLVEELVKNHQYVHVFEIKLCTNKPYGVIVDLVKVDALMRKIRFENKFGEIAIDQKSLWVSFRTKYLFFHLI